VLLQFLLYTQTCSFSWSVSGILDDGPLETVTSPRTWVDGLAFEKRERTSVRKTQASTLG